MFRHNLTMSPAFPQDEPVSPSTACAPLPLQSDDEAALDPDLGTAAAAAAAAAANAAEADHFSTVHRPAFWRRKSEEEFLRATVVCTSKSPSAARSRDGSLSSGCHSPKPSCLKRSPSAPQRPPHSKMGGLHPLRSKSIAGCDGDRRAVRFDSNPPVAAFTHSGKDYDRTPIESTQGRGGDLDVSLPPRGGSYSPDHDEDDDADAGEDEHHDSSEASTSKESDEAIAAAIAASVAAHSMLGPRLAMPERAATGSNNSTSSSPGLTSSSEGTSTSSGASSVLDDASEASSSAPSSLGSAGIHIPDVFPQHHQYGPPTSLSALMGLPSKSVVSFPSSPTAPAEAVAAVTAAANTLLLPPTTSVGEGNKFAAGVPCSTEVERAMLRRKLEFGGRWMKSFGNTLGGALGADDEGDEVPHQPQQDDSAAAAAAAAATSAYPGVVTASALDAAAAADPLLLMMEQQPGATSSDISVLSSTLCSSSITSSCDGGTMAFCPSSVGSDDSCSGSGSGSGFGFMGIGVGGQNKKEEQGAAVMMVQHKASSCTLSAVLTKTFLPMCGGGSDAGKAAQKEREESSIAIDGNSSGSSGGGGGGGEEDSVHELGRKIVQEEEERCRGESPTTPLLSPTPPSSHQRKACKLSLCPTSPASPLTQHDGSPASIATTTTTTTPPSVVVVKKKKKSSTGPSSPGGEKDKTSAFACRRDFLLESTMGGALDGF
ncbi:hypothetical protein OC835_005029 [Tilletia horrida]|nr:hypothetical protein OC835_005029 [Tilletia horrida]